MNLSTIQANLISLVGVIVSLLVGLAVLDGATAQIVTASAGTILSIAFSLFAELRTKTIVAAHAAGLTPTTLRQYGIKGIGR